MLSPIPPYKSPLDLKRVIEGDISFAANDLNTYSEDASIFKVMPQAIVYPKNAEDIKHLVKFVSEHKTEENNLSLTARSGGTDMSGGSLNESIILDMTRYFNHIGELKDKTLCTQPGVFYRNIEPLTHRQGLEMPSYPASKQICTIGGMVANNSGGEKSLRYGQTKDYIEQLRVVFSDGEEYTTKVLNETELRAKMAQSDFEGHIYRELFTLIEQNYDLIQSQ